MDPELNEPVESQEDDRRAAIEAAFEVHEPDPDGDDKSARSGSERTPEGVAPTPSEKTPEDAAGKPETPSATHAPDATADKAPQSWRPAEKAKWATLDPAVRQEVTRREREITTALNDSAQARSLAHEFANAVSPYMARIQSMGVRPTEAVAELFKVDHLLSTAPKQQRAQFMAKLIADYDVDVVALDAALSGQAPKDDVPSQVEQLLQQRLAPFQQFMAQQQARLQREEQESQQRTVQTVESMALDPKYPQFSEVRNDMADLIEIYSRRGVYLPLDEAYNRAIAMTGGTNQVVVQQQAAEANAQAQRALKASRSVRGTPNLGGLKSVDVNDRRATIAAAFDELGGR